MRSFPHDFYIPAVISGVAVSIIFGWLLNGNYGVTQLPAVPAGHRRPAVLVDPKWAIIAVIFASAFGVGSMMLIFYTDIKNIPIDLYEAAAIDGAGPARQFFSITLPMITPTILFNLITSIISSFQQVTLVMLLTNGGPMKSTYFYGLMTYNNAFKFHKLATPPPTHGSCSSSSCCLARWCSNLPVRGCSTSPRQTRTRPRRVRRQRARR